MHRSIRIDGTTLNVHLEGSGPPLVLLHGFPLKHSMWWEQIAEFRRTHHVIAPDLRGFGESDITPGLLTMEQFADDLPPLLDALNVRQPAVVCGLSMGGYIAFQFWKRHRSRLAGLILCDTRSAADAPQVKQDRETNAQRVLAEGPGFLAESMPLKLFSQQTHTDQQDLIDETTAVIRRTAPETIAGALRGMAARPDVTGWLPEIDVPTLVICGEEDAITPLAEMRSMAAAIPGSKFVSIPDAGHMAPQENPAPVNEAIRSFLADM